MRLGAPQLRLFELEASALRWFEAVRHAPASAEGPPSPLGEGRRKQKGSLRLYSSSSVEMARDGQLKLEFISSKERLTLLAESAETRDAWAAAIQAAIDALVQARACY